MGYVNMTRLPDLVDPVQMITWTNAQMEVSLFPPICLTALFICFMVFKAGGTSPLRAVSAALLITTVAFAFPFWLAGWMHFYYLIVGVVLSAVAGVALYYTDE